MLDLERSELQRVHYLDLLAMLNTSYGYDVEHLKLMRLLLMKRLRQGRNNEYS
jgi:hypothetical protein